MSEGRPLWQSAAAFAAKAHEHQVRKDGCTPYIAHPYRVAMTVRDLFGCDDRDALCAALLHDTIEDTPTDRDDIEDEFGPVVAEIVGALTKNMILPEREREPEYDARLARADWRARLIKLADVYDNLSDIESRPDAGVETLARMLARCQRAIDLATPDAARPEVARAIEIVGRAATDAQPG
ncbi:MAG: bifunctional (p)ppGpp synthetase/guanosine-3',5'-bis(diphosphate) 3'-pyrophosphohydrolase [Phycisphaerales bacterium]|nr:bifunctional (p)ppGpp synthetase/guanosine-3',5'-bis(diphosphate) 3'-pyrophosphohydrolase [Phycisphaerales bacterium]